MRRLALAILLLGSALGAARGEAVPISKGELSGLVWVATVDCAHAEDDLARRQCDAVKQARAAWAKGKTFIMRADAGALTVGDKELSLRGCLVCSAPVGGRFVVTRGGVTVADKKPRAPELAHTPNKLADAKVGERLLADITFRIPARADAWSQGGVSGVYVEALGWRVWDPCTGDLVLSSPPDASSDVDIDSSTCGVDDNLPDTPPAEAIRKVMNGFTAQVKRCREATGAAGKVDLWITVGGDGAVKSAEVRDELAGTPAATCITDASKKLVFPRFKRHSVQLHNKFNLR